MAKARKTAKKRPTPTKTTGSLLKDKAYSRIKERILSDKFSPGSFLSERQVASWLGMSKTPIKAAFERLEHEGFISVSPQQGVVVRDLNIHEIADHFELRVALESFVARNIAGRLTSEQIQLLKENLEAQKRSIENENVSESVFLDGSFHALICSFLGNQEMNRVINDLKDKIYRVVSRVFTRHPKRPVTSYAEHKRIANAILKGEADRAANLMTAHLENGKQFLLLPR